MRRYFIGGGAAAGIVFALFVSSGGQNLGTGGGRVMRTARYGGRGWPTTSAGPTFVNPSTTPQFEFPDLGTACACTTPTGLTFTRAGSAECFATDFQSSATCTTDQPRVMAGAVDDSVLGVVTEQTARTNLVWYSEDLSQAAKWTLSNMTCALTATGFHGANTASHCCATGANATALTRVLTADGANQASSMALKAPVALAGTLQVTAGDATYLADIAASLTTTWKRAVPNESLGCMASNGGTSRCIVQTGLWGAPLVPNVGFRLGTSGDCVDVALVQTERSSALSPATVGFASLPIRTSGGSAARAAEFGDVAMSGALAEQYCAAATILVNNVTFPHFVPLHGVPGSGTPGNATGSVSYDATYFDDTGTGYITAETTTVGSPFESALTAVVPIPTRMRVTSFYDGLYLNGCLNGACNSGTLFPGVASPNGGSYVDGNWTRFRLGAYDSSLKFDGITKQIQVDPNGVLCNRWLNTSPTQFAVVLGDSISRSSNGTVAGWWRNANATWAGSRQIITNAKSGAYTSYILSPEWELVARNRKYSHLFVLGGINDITQGHNMATALSELTTVWTEGISDGLHVHPMTLLPAGDRAGWDGGNEGERVSLNTSILAFCAAHPATTQCIDTENIAGLKCAGQVDGGPFPSICPAYNSGDGLHPNQAGEDLIGADVATEVP